MTSVTFRRLSVWVFGIGIGNPLITTLREVASSPLVACVSPKVECGGTHIRGDPEASDVVGSLKFAFFVQ